MTAPEQFNLADHVDPGEMHFWRVDFDKKSNRTPIKITLMLRKREGITALAEPIGWEKTIANEEKIIETAGVILIRVADRTRFIGDHMKEAS